jgi:hypothetical protein
MDKYPNLRNFTLSLAAGNGNKEQMKKLFEVFGREDGYLEKFDLTFFRRLSDDIFLPAIQKFQGMGV